MKDRNVGNRRSNEELFEIQSKLNEETYKLEEQKNFTGTEEQLKQMQLFERSYIDGKPLISDEEWDGLKKKFNYSESLSPESPSGRNWLKLMAPLPSIEKCSNKEELFKFLGKKDEGTTYKCEIKLDGLTANLRYELNEKSEDYELSHITSRGNGLYGLELNPYALYGVKTNFPTNISKDDVENAFGDLPESFEIRGEALIPKTKYTYEVYGKDSTWRSVAAGIFNRKVPFNIKGLYEMICPSLTKKGKNLNWEQMDIFDSGDRILISDPNFTLSDRRLFASLMRDNYVRSIRKNDKVYLHKDKSITIEYADGEIAHGDTYDEYLHIIFYSISFNGQNLDGGALYNLPVQTIKDLNYCFEVYDSFKYSYLPKTYLESNNWEEIWQFVCDFYGCDDDGVRNIEKIRVRNNLEYAADGVCIKPIDGISEGLEVRNAINNPNKIIMPKYPTNQVAVKLISELVKVKLVKIEYNKTDLENITCTGILDKEYITESGAKVSKINLHNPEWLEKNNWIKEDNEYWMSMAMDIIPTLLNI